MHLHVLHSQRTKYAQDVRSNILEATAVFKAGCHAHDSHELMINEHVL